MSELEAEVGEVEEPDAPEPDAPAPDSEPEPATAWSPPQEEWQQMTGVVQQLAALLQEPEQPQPDPMADFQFDPFDPESVQQMIDMRAQAIAQAQMEPFQGLLGMLSAREGEQLAKAELDRIQGDVGEFDHDMAFLIASGMVDNGSDPAGALRQSAGQVREFESKIRADERAKVEAEFQGLGTAPREQGVGSGEAVPGESVPTGPGRYDQIVERWRANQRPSMPVG